MAGMAGPGTPGPAIWMRACAAADLLAVDPAGLGGLLLRSRAGPVRDMWLDRLRRILPPDVPFRRLPSGIADDRLIGGLDLPATLAAGRPVARRGVLAEAHGGVLVAPMAERMEPGTAARIAGALDTAEIVMERDGFAARLPARIAVIALDEGADDDERPPVVLTDRLAIRLDLDMVAPNEALSHPFAPDPPAIAAARTLLPEVDLDEKALQALAATTEAFGVYSVRTMLLALSATRASAALRGNRAVDAEDLALAAALVIVPRATRLPTPPETDEADQEEPSQNNEPPPDPPPPPEEQRAENEPPKEDKNPALDRPLDDVVLEAIRAALPADLLASLVLAGTNASKGGGRAGGVARVAVRGRPIGSRRGDLVSGARLSVVDTLRAAAPWQPLRRNSTAPGRISVRHEDFRIRRFREHSETTTIFVVDASGSSALHRLAEAKGAVELMLADCYVRRDRVALIAFRGATAELLLPPTRALVRARRSLAGLPGGGGTPLATAIDLAGATARDIARRGGTPAIVFLTDGRANIDRQGRGDRTTAQADATASARAFAQSGLKALFIDTAPRPHLALRDLAGVMQAAYVPLPHGDSASIARIVQTNARAGARP